MKKILLILALALGVKLNGQIVGGFQPKNSTSSFTAGNSTFSNVIARGTLSVGSTATITGALKASSTMSLGSANLTGGNTGTVAVLSDAVFPVNLMAGSSSPADGSTQYIGSSGFVWANSAASGTVSLPYNCTLVGWQFNSVNSVQNGTSETSTISIMANGSESLVLSTSINFSLASGYNNFSGSGLSTNFSSGDKINLKIINPTWATNPQGIVAGVIFWFVRRP